MTPFAWFITIWAGFCVFGIIEVIKDWNKEPPKKKTYEERTDGNITYLNPGSCAWRAETGF